MSGPQELSVGRAGGSLKRRDFIVTAGAGVTGLLISSPTAAFAYASPLFSAIKQFAEAIRAKPVTDTVGAFIRRDEISKHTAVEVGRVNCVAQGESFSDLTRSEVFVPEDEKTYFFYSIRNKDGFNAAVSFFDMKREPYAQYVGVLGGPTLFGISALAASIAMKQLPPAAKKVFLPRKMIYTGGESMRKSYVRSDEYQTDAGKVRAHYTTNGRGRGTVTIEARNDRGTLLAGGDYDIMYQTAE